VDPTTKRLSIRASIQCLAATHTTNREIAERVGCSESTVKRWKRRDGINDLPRSGRPSVLTQDDKDNIQHMMQDVWGSSLRSTAAVLNNSIAFCQQEKQVSPWTVRNYLRTTTWGRVAYKATVKPFLSSKNVQDRINFCQMVQREGYCQDTPQDHLLLEHVLFTDEAPMVLSQVPNRQNCRIRTSSVESRIIEKHKKGISIMVAGGMCARGLTDLHIVDQRTMVDGEYYRNRIIPIYTAACWGGFAETLFPHGNVITFQQDGAPAHTAIATMRLLQEQFPRVWGKSVWPGNSPDLNPIEHVWAILQESIFVEPRPRSRLDLIARIQERWDDIRSSPLPRILVYSFPRRVTECLNNAGRHTSY
jgi:transposase